MGDDRDIATEEEGGGSDVDERDTGGGGCDGGGGERVEGGRELRSGMGTIWIIKGLRKALSYFVRRWLPAQLGWLVGWEGTTLRTGYASMMSYAGTGIELWRSCVTGPSHPGL